MVLTAWDRLGHKKTFEKTYFIPKESDGIKVTIEDEVRQRKSKIKVVGEGTNHKFGVDSSVDSSKENDQ